MFIDKVRISVKAGAGGNGAVAWTAATAATAAPSSCVWTTTCPR